MLYTTYRLTSSRGITGSGKSTSLRLLTAQLLRLSAHSKKEVALATQVKSLLTVLDAFGNAGCAAGVVEDNGGIHLRS